MWTWQYSLVQSTLKDEDEDIKTLPRRRKCEGRFSEWPCCRLLVSTEESRRFHSPPRAMSLRTWTSSVRIVGANVDGDVSNRKAYGHKHAFIDDVVQFCIRIWREREAVDAVVVQVVRSKIDFGNVGVAMHLQVYVWSHLVFDRHSDIPRSNSSCTKRNEDDENICKLQLRHGNGDLRWLRLST